MADPLPFLTSAPEVPWPAVPNSRASVRLAMQFQLDRSQWWSPETLRRYQLWQLGNVLRHASQHVPFYTDRGLPTGELTDEILAEIPILSRREVQVAGDRLRARQLPAGHGKVGQAQTSGSTGAPVVIWQSELVRFFWQTFNLRDHLWHRRAVSEPLAVIRHAEAPPPEGRSFESWGSSLGDAFQTGPLHLLSISSTSEQQADWLARVDPGYLLTHPTLVLELSRICKEKGIQLKRLREVRTLSEPVTDEIRRAVRDQWNVPLVDVYTTIEAGYLALQCPDHEHYHIQAESALVEVLDDDGRPCQPGQVGRVVVSTLHNFCSPLIRYEIGDYAEVGEPCSCGRGLPVLNRIMGRTRNMVTFPSGGRRWPVFKMMELAKVHPFEQIQLIQKTVDHIHVRLVSDSEFGEGTEEAFARALQETLGYPFEVSTEFVEAIPRSTRGKFEGFISEIPVADQGDS